MTNIVGIVALVCLGLYAGSLLTEGFVLVPIWRRLPADEFFRMHEDVGPRLFRYFAPITIAGVMVPIIDAGVAVATRQQALSLVLAAAGMCVAALLTFFGYFRAANQRFAERSISDDGLGSELARWAFVHWVRTILIVTAFTLLAVSRIDGGAVDSAEHSRSAVKRAIAELPTSEIRQVTFLGKDRKHDSYERCSRRRTTT